MFNGIHNTVAPILLAPPTKDYILAPPTKDHM